MVITTVVIIGKTLELVIITVVVITIVEGVSMVATGEIAVVVILIIKTGIVVSTDSWDVIIIALVGTSSTDKLPPFMILAYSYIVFVTVSAKTSHVRTKI